MGREVIEYRENEPSVFRRKLIWIMIGEDYDGWKISNYLMNDEKRGLIYEPFPNNQEDPQNSSYSFYDYNKESCILFDKFVSCKPDFIIPLIRQNDRVKIEYTREGIKYEKDVHANEIIFVSKEEPEKFLRNFNYKVDALYTSPESFIEADQKNI